MPPTNVKVTIANSEEFVVIPYAAIVPYSKMIETVSTLGGDEDTVIISVDIESCKPSKVTLEALKEYVDLINSQPPSVVRQAPADLTPLITQAEMSFLQKYTGDDRIEMKRLLQLGCFLQMEPLRNIIAAWWASGITKMVDEIEDHDECVEKLREYIGVENDWSPEELAVLREQAKWAQ